MAEKKKVTPAKKVVAKKPVAAKHAAAAKPRKGQGLVCEVCGMSVVVDEVCGCVETHEIVCCGTPMKAKTAKPKVASKAK